VRATSREWIGLFVSVRVLPAIKLLVEIGFKVMETGGRSASSPRKPSSP